MEGIRRRVRSLAMYPKLLSDAASRITESVDLTPRHGERRILQRSSWRRSLGWGPYPSLLQSQARGAADAVATRFRKGLALGDHAVQS